MEINKLILEKELKLYAVRNKEGKFFKSKGYNGYRQTVWYEDINKAKIYSKIGQARSVITFFSKNFPEYGIPDLVEINVNTLTLINESERVDKAIKKIENKKIESEQQALKIDIENAKRNLDDAQKRYNDSINKLK